MRVFKPGKPIIKRCRPLARNGEYCESDDGCKGDLKCLTAPSNIGVLNTNRCYDPAKILLKGARCNPNLRRQKSKCVVDKSRSPPRPLKCLPTRRGFFTCQFEAGLFEHCSVKENIACQIGLVCNKNAICVPFENKQTSLRFK